MRLFSLALAASLVASSALAAPILTPTVPVHTVANPVAPGASPMPSTVTADPDWSAGYEAGYMEICGVTPAERAAWASPVVTPSPIAVVRQPDASQHASGFMAALEDLESYEEAGFDAYEYCGDNQP